MPNAARMAMGMEAHVTVIDRSLDRLYELDLQFGPMLNTIYSTVDAIERNVVAADLVIGAVLVDIAIDQGGCFETSKPTSHAEPTYVEEGCVHYCVTNMPGAVARTSTIALNNATLPFGLALADKGYKQALMDNPHLRNGLNVAGGKVTYEAVAEAHGLDYTPAEDLLGA